MSEMHHEARPSIFEKARALKKSETKAEKILWEALRNKQLKGFKFRRQHPVDIFILDFYCHELKLAIEVDGSIHDEQENKEYDTGRTFELEQSGIKVIRFQNEVILQNLEEVLKSIEYHLTTGQPSSPSPTGRGTESRASGIQGEVTPRTYIVVEFNPVTPEQKEFLLAILPDYGCEGIEELETSLKCYVPENLFAPETLKDFLQQFSLDIPFTHQPLPNKNWNEAWEKSYEPIIVTDQVIIKASFHQVEKSYPFEILVDPQMSFGTGHHETTQLMVEAMLGMDFMNKSVLDFGSGTGVLSILAHKMKAKSVVAIDIDEWAYNNIIENMEKNGAASIRPLLGTADVLPSEYYEIVLANVNKNILLEHMEILVSGLLKNGVILFSGLLLQDEQDFVQSAGENGLILLEKKIKKEWLCLKFSKQ